MSELAQVVRAAREGLGRGDPVVMVTVVGARGSTYRRPGARMVLVGSQRRAGCVSGGCLERDLERRAGFIVRGGGPVLQRYDTSAEAVVQLGCGGEIDLLLEPLCEPELLDVFDRVCSNRETLTVRTSIDDRPGEREIFHAGKRVFASGRAALDGRACFEEVLRPSPRLLVVGAGHDAMPVAGLACALGWGVDVADFRRAWLTEERFPAARRHLLGPEALGAGEPPREPGMVAVVMSHHVAYDAAALAGLLRDERFLSVGLLGPPHRAAEVLERAQANRAFTSIEQTRLRAPVGLDLGAEGPDGVALSILAEAQAVLTGGSGRPLREVRRGR